MAAKTANVMARVEPNVKEQAEEIMEMLGIPVSVVINTLYKQIIMTRSIPFSLSVPAVPVARDEMDEAAFHASQACKQDAAGVINTYYLDLDSLSVKAPEQQVLSGFDGYDVVIPQEEAACYISICSEAALNSLVFTNASFVCQ